MFPTPSLGSLLRCACLFAALFAACLAAQPQLEFTQVSSHRTVVDIANAGDGSGRLFLVRQSGTIHINLAGDDLETPFLNISGRVMDLGEEQGLLSVAFPPDYEVSGHF